MTLTLRDKALKILEYREACAKAGIVVGDATLVDYTSITDLELIRTVVDWKNWTGGTRQTISAWVTYHENEYGNELYLKDAESDQKIEKGPSASRQPGP